MKRKTDNFSKFYNKKNNAAIKEAFRQEKKAAKKERKEAIERHFEEKRKAREQQLAAAADREAIMKKGPERPGRPAAGKFSSNKPAPAPGKPAFSNPAQAAIPAPKGPAPASASGKPAPAGAPVSSTDPNSLPLNKYIAHGGICSRRDAADLIREGKVSVNGKPVTEPGTKVLPTDTVKVNGKKVTISRNFVYILLNKPKDYITTAEDPQGRKTVLDLIRQATPERVYPVGRLDRNTSGVLLLTNDGDLAQKLSHPKHEIKKIYHVTLDKPLTKADFDKIAEGVTLEDGIAHVDVLAYADPRDKTQIGLEIHSGRNRIVRRIFEHLGYDVRGLDRVMYAGLTKKNVQRGKWRLLTEREIRILKYLNSSFRGSPAPAAKKPAASPSPASAKPVAFLSPAPAAKSNPMAPAAKKPAPAKRAAPPAVPASKEHRPAASSGPARPKATRPKTGRSAAASKPNPRARATKKPAASASPFPAPKRPAAPKRTK